MVTNDSLKFKAVKFSVKLNIPNVESIWIRSIYIINFFEHLVMSGVEMQMEHYPVLQ